MVLILCQILSVFCPYWAAKNRTYEIWQVEFSPKPSDYPPPPLDPGETALRPPQVADTAPPPSPPTAHILPEATVVPVPVPTLAGKSGVF